MPLWKMINVGGITMYILLGYSVLSLAIIIERFVYYRKRSRVKRTDFMSEIREQLVKGSVKSAILLCDNTDTPFSSVVHSGINLYGHSEVVISNTMEREIAVETTKLERFTSIVGTIAGTSVYVGLFGTVLGIMRAFHDIAQSGSGGLSVVIIGLTQALITTAAGLIIAVPAVIAYNYFIKKIDNFVVDMELCASEAMDLITAKQK